MFSNFKINKFNKGHYNMKKIMKSHEKALSEKGRESDRYKQKKLPHKQKKTIQKEKE